MRGQENYGRMAYEIVLFYCTENNHGCTSCGICTGVLGHNGMCSCPWCKVQGEQVIREGLASTSAQQNNPHSRSISFSQWNCKKRTLAEFITATADLPDLPMCDDEKCMSQNCWSESYLEYNEFDSNDKDDCGEEANVGDLLVDLKIVINQRPKMKQKKKKKKKNMDEDNYYRHRTILTEIKDLDMVNDIPLDYLHLVLSLIHISEPTRPY